MRAWFLFAFVLAAGCTQTTSVQPPAEAPTEPTFGGLIGYACPPGKTTERVPGICVGTLASLTESFQEPYLAAHPRQPLVLALGVNQGETVGSLQANSADPWVSYVGHVEVFLTEDGGATWKDTEIPQPTDTAGQLVIGADPVVGFDLRGRLHVIGMGFATMDPQFRTGGTGGIFHTFSDDLGRTWTPPYLFEGDGAPDRPWMAIGDAGEVIVTWSEEGALGAARSMDRGTTWRQTKLPMCDAGKPAFLGRDAWLSCFSKGVTILRWGASDEAPAEITTLPWETRVSLFTIPGVGLAAAPLQTVRSQWPVATSADGATWSDAGDVLALATVDDSLSDLWIFGFSSDSEGRIHALVGGAPCLPQVSRGISRCEIQGARHIVFDPVGRRLLHEAVLAASGGHAPRRIPPTAEQLFGGYDDYYGLAFGAHGGYLAWTADRGIDFTRVLLTPLSQSNG